MSNTKIKNILARQLIDCKCRPMVEVDVICEDGTVGSGSAPTGSSVGIHEAFVLRDNNKYEYDGMSVHKAVHNVEEILRPALIGMDVQDQRSIDETMIDLDGTPNKSKLGGNAIYSTSIAVLRAAANAEHTTTYRYLAGGDIKTVPVPSFNVINGGRYGDITLAFNEFLIVPYKADDIHEAVHIGTQVFQKLQSVISGHLGKEPIVARSYGWAAPSDDPEVVLYLMQKAVEECGYQDKVVFGLDCASSEMYDQKTNTYLMKGKRVSADELIDYTKGLAKRFPLLFIEDLLGEDDWSGFKNAVKNIDRSMIIGDDFTVTNMDRINRAYEMKAIDGFVLKPNQVGTITQALDAYDFAKQHDLFVIPSGRAGGVTNDIIMDLAVGLQVRMIKNGAPRSGERIDKLNFLMRAASLHPGCTLADLSSAVKF
jgi:enolase